GTFKNFKEFSIRAGEDVWVKRGDAAFEQDRTAQTASFTNNGTIVNEGERARIELTGAEAVNSGTVSNGEDSEFVVCSDIRTKCELTLESVAGEPETDDEWAWFYEWIDGEDAYWKMGEDNYTVAGIISASFTNTDDGVFENSGNVRIENATFAVETGATFNNESDVELADRGSGRVFWLDDEASRTAAMGSYKLPEPKLAVAGTFNNGVITNVGDGDGGSNANTRMWNGIFENTGSVTSNGYMELNDSAYTQSSDGRFENYNSSALEVSGGSITVPSGAFFKNEGYMRITDRYGEAYAPCDLSGFDDFFTTWNQDGNDSDWCDFAAEVYDEDGYDEACQVQSGRPENMRYNRIDFRDDITFTHDVVFDGFGQYWLMDHSVRGWSIYDEQTDSWQEVPEGTPGAEEYWYSVGSTMTVAAGATLTVAQDNTLYADGWTDEWEEQIISNTLVVNGSLVTEAGQEPEEQNGWIWKGEGRVEIWADGSFESTGTVENNGYFEVRYKENTDGSFMRSDECPVTGAPADAVMTAEVRTEDGLINAVASTSPVFGRITIREDSNIEITDDITIPETVGQTDIEPGSGLIIDHGVTLTADGFISNSGDVSVYGDMVINGRFGNNQSLEIGDADGNEQAVVTIGEGAELWSEGFIDVRATGSIVFAGHESRVTVSGEDEITVNGVTAHTVDGYGSYTLCTLVEHDDQEDTDRRVFQVDHNEGAAVKLTGTLEGYDELRLQQGEIDISELEVDGSTEIRINDEWTYTNVNIGSKKVIVNQWERESYNGVEITAAQGAEIVVINAQLLQNEFGYYGTYVRVNADGSSYELNPHIFGARGDNESAAIYTGTDDENVSYSVWTDGGTSELQYEAQFRVDDENKTHLSRKADEDWFYAGQGEYADVKLEAELPGGVTVVYDPVPVKPEQLD
ncbi:MAG: hypothetical protein IKR08_06835, partial [Firmicutes bacterium]|nr:hypothetical protein [Bacillota bacterium]